MLARAAIQVFNKQVLKPLQWETSLVCVFGAKFFLECTHLWPGTFKTCQRTFCIPAWHKTLGKVPRPRKEKVQSKSSEIVPIENLVDQRSLIVLENIHDALSTSEVFQAIRKLGRELNEVHIAQAIIKFAKIHNQKSTRKHVQKDSQNSTQLPTVTEANRLDVNQDKEFVHLCHLTLQHTKVMDSVTLINVLKAVIDLGVPQSSVMVQTLLVNSEHRLNHLNCDELALFASKLAHMQQSDQRVHALFKAIALLIPERINTCINTTSLNTLLHTAGRYLDRHTQAHMAIRFIAIVNVKQDMKQQEVVLATAYAIIGFHSVGYRNEEFLNEACEILIKGIQYLPSAKLMQILASLSSLKYYSPGLLEEAGELIASRVQKFSLIDLSRILNSYCVHRFLHKKLLNTVASSLINRSLDGVHVATLIGMVAPFAKFHYTTAVDVFDQIADVAERKLNSCPEQDVNHNQLVHLVVLLAMCGSYSPKLVMSALSKICYESVMTEKDPKAFTYLHLIYTIVNIDRPELFPAIRHSPSDIDHYLHLSNTLDQFDQVRSDANTKQNDKLKLSVAEVLQDVTQNTQHYLESDCVICHGYSVDFVIRDQELAKPPIAIDLTRHVQYCANFPDRLLGREVMKTRHLHALGYSLHMIPRDEWMAIASHQDRVEYIHRKLSLIS